SPWRGRGTRHARPYKLFLLSPDRGRGWERGLQETFAAPSPNFSPYRGRGTRSATLPAMTTKGIRGAFFDFVDDPWKHVGREHEAARFLPDGLLVIEDGRIVDFGSFEQTAPRHRALEITHIPDRLILPGFIDGHIHFPQTRVLGKFGEQLLPWL